MFWIWTKCPHCRERIRKKATLCKHCRSAIGGNGNGSARADEECVKYLQNGFGKINAECDTIEEKISARTGFIFIKHQYSSDDLLEAVSKIESFVEKMRDDLEEWDSAGNLTGQVKLLFNRKAGEAYQRLESIQTEIERREPTWWEKVVTVFKRIIAKLFPFLSFKLIAGKKAPKEIAA